MSKQQPYQLTARSETLLSQAITSARNQQHSVVNPFHLAYALIGGTSAGDKTTSPASSSNKPTLFVSVLDKITANSSVSSSSSIINAFRTELFKLMTSKSSKVSPPPDEPELSTGLLKLLSAARDEQHTEQKNDSFISEDHLIIGLLSTEPLVLSALTKTIPTATLPHVRSVLRELRAGRPVNSAHSDADGYETLSKYTTDLTQLASEGKLDPVIGRDDEVRRVIRVLSRRTKNNCCLIGEPGVGKTAIADALAQRIMNGDVPGNLRGKLLALDLAGLMAGAKYKGEYEERVKALLNEITQLSERGDEILLFIDEMHGIVAGQGSDSGGMDLANLLKPMLARGKLRVIGATTLSEYRKYIEKDAALERRFQQILVNEPDVPATITILRGISEKYAVHHGVRILDSSLIAAATLAKRYLTARKLPDSAIDVLDEASAGVRVNRDTVPEEIDKLERKKLQIQVEIHSLQKEKDSASKDRLQLAQQALQDLDEQLTPIKLAHENLKLKGDELNNLRKRIEELNRKADAAEQRRDLSTCADLRYGAIPQLKEKLTLLENKKREDEAQGVEQEQDIVTPESIAEVVARWTGIPATKLAKTETQKLLAIERTLAKNVIGQPEAVKSIAEAVRLSRSGLGNANRPLASFMFAGSSGVGKTLVSKQLSNFLYNGEMLRIDMSEFSEKHSISRLIGSPPGYVGHENGGVLTEYIRRKPFSVILLDEVEKASREVMQLFLQILDDGRCTDSQGRTVSFLNTIIIMTSNLGSSYLTSAGDGPIDAQTRELVNGAISAHFPPELINRLDEIIIFRNLGLAEVRRIVDVRLSEIQQRLKENGRKILLEVDDDAKTWLATVGFHPVYGARPLNRAIQQEVLNPMSKLILENRIRDGEVARVQGDLKLNKLNIIANHELETVPIEEDDMMDTDDDVVVEEMD